MLLYAEALVVAERAEARWRFAALLWARRGRQDLAEAAGRGDVEAVESAIATATKGEREQVRVAAEVLLGALEGQRGRGGER